MDGIDAEVTRKFFEKVWLTLEEQDVPYTLHWGKMNFILNEQRVIKMYGADTINNWINCRHSLMTEPARRVFTNEFMEICGLDK
jgi:hypothetical protein